VNFGKFDLARELAEKYKVTFSLMIKIQQNIDLKRDGLL
jgi:hypothetical protein